ncbi:hybrid non-ribosomal peptide synthetase/type I polyketide synthase [Altererythrobacter sp. CAU 1778]
MNGNMTDAFENGLDDAIAIVGMAGRFPGAACVEDFWQNQRSGKISISHFSEEELRDCFDPSIRQDENFVSARGVLDDADLFDAELFGMYAREAKLTDPQHRVFLEVSLAALEVAGLDPARATGPVGVFAGASMPTYLVGHVLSGGDGPARAFASNYQLGGMDTLVGSLPDALATRVAYKLDLKGPAFTVQSACSTSLLAVAQACQSLLMYQCDAALAGGVSITFPQQRGYLYQDGGMGSRDGTCRPFDRDASGTVFGSGAAVVVLKRLSDALRDKDEIVALIRGAGIANDGANKVAFTGPSAEGQAAAIASAIAEAGVDPASIGYVELHGTATPLGDPIEFDGLRHAFGPDCETGGCVLGSAKANIGHLDAAAGVTGLIKAALCLRNEEIPPLANFTAPNPHIDLADSPFRIVSELQPWPRTDVPRRAGVSSFGVGGTNVHIVLEEPPFPPRRTAAEGLQILPFSAKSDAALDAQAHALSAHLARHPGTELRDVAFTLAQGRTRRESRGAVVARSTAEAAEKLAAFSSRSIRAQASDAPPVVFMFPGQGSQYPGMGANLYRGEPTYRRWIDRGADLLLDTLERDVRDLLYRTQDIGEDAAHPIRSTIYAQPALFLTQFALVQLWLERGVRPAAMIGHSVGELVAATVAGVLSFEDGLALVARRAALMQSAEPGAMLAVRMAEEDLLPLLGDGVDLAAVNAPSLCVAAGPFDAIARLEDRLEAAGSEGRRLHTSHAFHSEMMQPVVAELEKLACGFAYGEAAIPYVSGVSGDWAAGEYSACGEYWARHCRAPVRFAEALRTVVGSSRPILLEVGPGRTLATFAGQGLSRNDYLAAVPSMPDFSDAADDETKLAEAMARLWCLGAELRWDDFYGEEARRVPLPPYQFQRHSYWIEPAEAPNAAASDGSDTAIDPVPPAVTPATGASSVADSPSRSQRLSGEVAALLEDLSGESISDTEWSRDFLELGFDSLFLGQVATQLKRTFGIKVTFRQLMNDYPSIEALVAHLDATLPPDPPAAAVTGESVAQVATDAPIASGAMPQPAAEPGQAGDLAATFAAQLAAMQAVIDGQLALIGSKPAAHSQTVPPSGRDALPRSGAGGASTPAPALPEMPLVETAEAGERFRPFNARAARDADPITDEQRRFIDDLVAQYCARMPTSKAQAARHRSYFSDPRTAAGFRPEWKEMVFPVVAERSKGSKLWDADGNEFVDLVNGYGQTAFGHAPDFVVEAVAAQMEKGFAIGPQTPLAGEVAARIARMVDLDRVTFCNTGSEAIMAAMRLARCVSGRDKVVVFNNDYHGQFDEVLVKAGGKAGFARALPIAPGIPGDSIANMVVLPYGSSQALDWIRANARDVAAVIVEPVQSRHPELLPFEFLRELRSLTRESEIALVFDEVVTGFRTHPGGMQAVLGISADMATYGKVIGGGMPIGILAGSAQYMDALDGGSWNYGDDSVPEVAPTFFAGTFVRHPLALAACNAVLDFLERSGPQMQADLASRTAGLVERIDAAFASRGVAVRAPTYSSWFMLDTANGDRLGALFNQHMRLKGVHIIDGYPCFLTTAHSDEDLDLIVGAVGETLDALQAVGIFKGDGAAQPVRADAPVPLEMPLTEPQLEILLATQMGPEASTAYNESLSIEFGGIVDHAALAEAINAFVARHEAMRATAKPGEPTLVIASNLTIEVPRIERANEADLARIKSAEATTPFDLERGPLLRATLVERDDGTSVLIACAHHIVFDGWTANLFAEEIAALYRERTGHGAADLDPAMPFTRYAAELANEGERAEADLAYWRNLFATLPDPVELPVDRPRPALKSFAGASHTSLIDADLAAAAKAAGAKLGCSLFVTLFAAVQTAIGRLANTDDVVLVCPTAGQAEVEDGALAGHCVNFLPLRVPMAKGARLADHLAAVKAGVLEAFDHGTATYGAIVRALELPRSTNRSPLTDIQFNLERVSDAIDFGTTTGNLRANAKAAVNFDLFFNLVECSDGLRVEVDYASDLFDETTIERWVENLRQVLRALVADPAQAIDDIDVLGSQERAWLDARNPVWPPLPDDCSLVSEFRRAAGGFADRVALSADGVTRTYGELESHTNRLARALLARGIGRGDHVALLANRSIAAMEMIVAVIKTGAAYVPLDPAYPAARQRYVLEDCGARQALLGPGAEDAEAYAELKDTGLSYDALRAEADGLSDAAPDVAIRADDPVYVMYTSGSTGKPKGVVVPHRGIVRLVVDQDYVDLGPDETLLLLTALGFDLCQFEIWGALLFGGRLAIFTDSKPSLAGIEQAIVREGVTTMLLAAALFHLIVEEKVTALAPLRQLVIGADVVSRTHIRKAQKALPHVRFVNGYGPTENSGLTTCYAFPAEGWGPGSSPIGEPIARSSAFIMDPRGHLSPRGSIGELWSGGEGVAIEYLGKPDLTAERFVTHPDDPAVRLYRTGDYARWRTDGAIEFLGRIDGQLKINGMRVELDEIEAVLSDFGSVAEAAVAVRETTSGGRTVHAFVTVASGETIDMEALRQHMAEALPRHMQPSSTHIVEALPRNANGKIDRLALRDRADAGPAANDSGADKKAMTGLEQRVAAIWAEVLGLDTVSRDDAIFDLGADSLQIFRIAARMAAQGLEIENRKLLTNPTLAEVAALIDGLATGDTPPPAPKVAKLSAYRREALQGAGA